MEQIIPFQWNGTFPKIKKIACTNTATIFMSVKGDVYYTGKLCTKWKCKYGLEKIPLKEPAKDIFASKMGSVIITTTVGAYGFGLNYYKNLGLENTDRPHDQEHYYVLQPEKIKELENIMVENIVMCGAFTFVQGRVNIRNDCNLQDKLKRTLDTMLRSRQDTYGYEPDTLFKFDQRIHY
jgi:hypothetical protein